MSITEPSKYALDQFLSATDRRFLLMSEIVADTISRAPIAVGGYAAFTTVLANLDLAAVNWTAGEITSINADARAANKNHLTALRPNDIGG